MRIIHAADLHLTTKADKDYGLSVLREIVEIAMRDDCDLLVFSGDVFDTFDCLDQLRAPVREIVGSYQGKTLMIPGNHEDLGRASRDFAAYDLGSLQVLTAKPFSLQMIMTRSGPLEVLAIPHQNEAFDYRSWPVPPKRTVHRIALAHGLVQGMSYAGPDVEEGGESLDPDLFSHFNVDYAALGHIHGRREERRGTTLLAYSGSARVWRSGESGERCVNIVEFGGGNPRLKAEPLKTAGLYRNIELPINIDGTLPSVDTSVWGPNDLVEIKLSGLVEDENVVKSVCEAFEVTHKNTVRKLAFKREDLIILAGVSQQPLAKRFLELWKKSSPEITSTGLSPKDRDFEVWRCAREIALKEMKRLLEDA